jgi:serine protease Do
MPNSPAVAGGFKPGDIVTRFGDQKIDSPNTLQQFVERVPPNTQHSVEVWREGKSVTLKVTPEPLPKDIELAGSRGFTPDEPSPNRETFEAKGLGLEVADLTAEQAKQLGLSADEGVLITSVAPEGIAFEQNLRAGHVILKVGKTEVKSVEEFKSALKSESLKDGILLYVHSRNGNDFVLLKE